MDRGDLESSHWLLEGFARLRALPRRALAGVSDHPYEQGFDLKLWPSRLGQPLRWKRPRMIFVNSMSDLFHEDIPLEFIADVFDVMARADHHTFQILTKRHERLAEVAGKLNWPANVWMGVSVENRRFVGRADALRQVPAAVRFISAEPLLGRLGGLDLDAIDWLIAGGESGPRHRPVKAEWIRELRDRCQSEGVAFFFKQWGGIRSKAGGRVFDGRTWDEMPVGHVSHPALGSGMKSVLAGTS
jgi:protein gp37